MLESEHADKSNPSMATAELLWCWTRFDIGPCTPVHHPVVPFYRSAHFVGAFESLWLLQDRYIVLYSKFQHNCAHPVCSTFKQTKPVLIIVF